MSDRATAVNPQVLRWAREKTGLSLSAVAERLKKKRDVVAAWETGTRAPTFRQLEELADRLYKRPVAVFFFPAPPEEEDPRSQFRTLPESELEALASDTRYALREALAFQESIREFTGGANPSRKVITREIVPKRNQPVEELARQVRDYLGVSLDQQTSWRNAESAFKEWRGTLENVGVFVFKRSFKQEDVFGFCVHDRELPLIVVNNSTAHSRQVFTLFHELGHLLFSVSGITKSNTSYIDQLSGRAYSVEVACNRFAAEFLVPNSTFPWDVAGDADLEVFVSSEAKRYNVSREVILRRLVDRGLVDQTTYLNKTRHWTREFKQSRQGRTGGNYYATQATYLGQAFSRLAFSKYHKGEISLEQLAGHLRVKARNVARLEDFLIGGE